MKNSWLVSILLMLSVVSCRSYTHQFTPVASSIDCFTPPFLDTNHFEHSFKANIDAYGHTLSGILVIKKIEEHHYRMALLNEFGGTMMSFELLNGDLKLHYAIPPLHRKPLLNILKKDFALLLGENLPVYRQYTFEDTYVFETRNVGKYIYYYINRSDGKLEKAVLTNRRREHLSIHYNYRHPTLPDITLTHKRTKLNIFLFLLKEADAHAATPSP